MKKTFLRAATLILLGICVVFYSINLLQIDNSIKYLDFIRSFVSIFMLFLSIIYLSRTSNKLLKLFSISSLSILIFAGTIISACATYFKSQDRLMQASDIYAILQTDSYEAMSFLDLFFISKEILLTSLAFLSIAIISTLFSLRFLRLPISRTGLSFASAGVIIGLIIFVQLHPIKKVFRHWKRYNLEMSLFQEHLEALQAESQYYSKAETGEVLVMVIGESASRDYMHVYSDYPVANTPWMSSQTGKPGWHLFTQAYSHHTHTVPTLSASLTEGRQITGLTYPKGSNLISISNSAGLKTAWFSNQGRLGKFDTPISVLGAQAQTYDHTTITKEDDSYRPLDEKLLPQFQNFLASLDPEDNALIVLHLAGNHWPYYETYPMDFSFPSPQDLGMIGKAANSSRLSTFSEYMTSLAYTDSILQRVHEALQRLERPVGLIYFSDHGDDVFSKSGGHVFASMTWTMARIPMAVWLSDAYRLRYPEKNLALAANRNKIFTNDLIFDLYIGLLNVDHPAHRAKFDPSSAEYALTVDEARMYDDRKISDDFHTRIPRLETGKKLAVHRANTVFKAKQAFYAGIHRLEVDLVYKEDAGGVGDLWMGHGEANNMTGFNLDEYLSYTADSVDFLWLDIKNLTAETAPNILAILHRLDQKYDLRSKVLVESRYAEGLALASEQGWPTSLYLEANIMKRLAKSDPAALQTYADARITEVIQLALPSVSFDLQDYPLVHDYILSRLPDSTTYHAWNVDWYWHEPDIEEKIAKYPSIVNLLISMESPFHY